MKNKGIENNNMKNNNIGLYALVFLQAACLVLFAGCRNGNETGTGAEPLQGKKRVARLATTVQQADVIECKGIIESEGHFTHFLREQETIAAFTVTEGAEVRKGDVLVRLSNYAALKEYTDLSYRKLQYNEKKNNLVVLEMEIERAEKDLADLKKELALQGKKGKEMKDYPLGLQLVRLKKELEKQEEALKILTTRRDFLKTGVAEEGKIISILDSRLAEVRGRMNSMDIRAPFDGTAVYVPAAAENLRPGDRVIEVIDNNRLHVRADVWQHQLRHIKKGNSAQVFPDFFGDNFIKGTVARIRFSPVKAPGEQYPRFPVYIDLETGNKELKAGMSVTVKIKKQA